MKTSRASSCNAYTHYSGLGQGERVSSGDKYCQISIKKKTRLLTLVLPQTKDSFHTSSSLQLIDISPWHSQAIMFYRLVLT